MDGVSAARCPKRGRRRLGGKSHVGDPGVLEVSGPEALSAGIAAGKGTRRHKAEARIRW